MDDPLDRYRPIVDDFAAFRAACERPLPVAVRVNGIKADPDRVVRAFEEAGLGYERADWHSGLFRVDTDRPGATWPFVHGWIHGQEEVSLLPPIALDPGPDDVVFDACAAPGSKTTQIAALMDDRGRLVANDKNLGRLSPLRSNAERLGVTNVAVTHQDARNFSLKPFDLDAFDRALVDVPCSCEGTIRKNPDTLAEWSLDRVESLAPVQTDLLRRAVGATREGGTVVYSTCTFAPEENEAVLDRVLADDDCHCRVVDPGLPEAFDHAPGVTGFEGETYDPAVRRAARVYPHHNDTGGFFCARLEVTGS
jgi:NOL1/NOP2/sun family putative RNA methylase